MHSRTSSVPPRVDILTGKHSVVIPSGTEELIAEKLAAAGFNGGDWKALLGGFVKGTPHTPDFRVRGVEGRSVIVRVHPGGNNSCTQLRLIVPNAFDPQLVGNALARLAAPENGGHASMQELGVPENDDPEDAMQKLPCTISDVLSDATLFDLMLDALRSHYPTSFSPAGFVGTAALLFDMPMSTSDGEQLLSALREQGHIEPAPFEDTIGYRLTRRAFERIGAGEHLRDSDDLALTAGLQISQLRADAAGYLALELRRDELVAEMEDLDRRSADRRQRLKEVETHLEQHPGKEAAKKWKAAQALLNITD